MFLPQEKDKKQTKNPSKELAMIFDDLEAKRNIVGLYDLLLKIAKRNPKLWAKIQQPTKNHD